jgi:mannose-6-phosphate isomerase-like protein (cupin superfamily)
MLPKPCVVVLWCVLAGASCAVAADPGAAAASVPPAATGVPPGAWVALTALAGRSAAEIGAIPPAPVTIPRDATVPAAMRIKRVVAGPDGKSRLDVIELPIVSAEPGKSLYSRLHATDVELGYGAPGAFIDWHRVTTPRIWILLQGSWEFGTGDGKIHRLEAGDIVLAADTAGQGHTSRNVGAVASFVLTVRLPAEDSLQPKTAR